MSPPRSHLVDRAVEAMGGLDALVAPPRPAPYSVPLAETIRAVAAPVREPVDAPPVGAPPLGALTQTPSRAEPGVTLATLVAAGLVPDGGVGRNRALEEVRIVGHGVLRTVAAGPVADSRSRVILVTSARPGEGKSFMALNVAAGLATDGSQPVVLVDTDGKPGSLSHLLGLAGRAGLRSLASEAGRTVRGLLVPTEVRRLSILPYGAVTTGAAPSGATLAAAVRAAAQALPGYLIVLDSPPCLVTSDPGGLANVAGQTLLVVEAERTQRSELEAALDLVEASPVLQLVLNKARFSDRDTFGTYAAAYGMSGR